VTCHMKADIRGLIMLAYSFFAFVGFLNTLFWKFLECLKYLFSFHASLTACDRPNFIRAPDNFTHGPGRLYLV